MASLELKNPTPSQITWELNNYNKPNKGWDFTQ